MRSSRRNTRRDFCSITRHMAIRMKARTHWTHSDMWSQLATMPEWSSNIGDWKSEKKRWNYDRGVICNATCGIHAWRGVIHHWGVLDSSDGVRQLGRSHSTRTYMFLLMWYILIVSIPVSSYTHSMFNCARPWSFLIPEKQPRRPSTSVIMVAASATLLSVS